MLEHVTHEITISALPTDIPDSIAADVSGMVIGDTLQLSAVVAPEGIEFALGEDVDPDEVTIATLNPPRVEEEPEPELEEEAELVGEDGEPLEGEEAAEGEEGEAPRARSPRSSARAATPATRARPCASSGAARDDAVPTPPNGSSSSVWATPDRSTRRPATTSASRSPPSSRAAGSCRRQSRSTAA